ncbi:hypothetical protein YASMINEVIRUS_285, partial [Yasminevirus sp. GU-2018]
LSIFSDSVVMLCQYKDIFGAPNTGAHAYRIFDLAVVDVVSTIIVGFLIYWILSKYYATLTLFHLMYIMLALFALGIIAHRMFCVRTTVDKLLFSDQSDDC